MTLSAKWQKFYQLYCTAWCILTAILILLTVIGGTAWEVRNELVHAVALYLGVGLAVCVLFHLNLLLWIVSLIVWILHRDSARGWHILGYGLLMGIAGIVDLMGYAIVSGA